MIVMQMMNNPGDIVKQDNDKIEEFGIFID